LLPESDAVFKINLTGLFEFEAAGFLNDGLKIGGGRFVRRKLLPLKGRSFCAT
jgi:hypothetical protein